MEVKLPDPLDVIKQLRKSFYGSTMVYTNGSCAHLFHLLKTIYPDAKMYSDEDHVITKIGEYYYDILGMYDEDEIKKHNYILVESGIYNTKFPEYKFDVSISKYDNCSLLRHRVSIIEELGIMDHLDQICDAVNLHREHVIYELFCSGKIGELVIDKIKNITGVDIQEEAYYRAVVNIYPTPMKPIKTSNVN